MDLPQGIGPHEGRELELMLKGEKPCAMFHDVVPTNGIIPEDIIPERAFAPYVASGKFTRISHDVQTKGAIVRRVYFACSGEEWRPQALTWLSTQADEAAEIMTGRLLGYSDTEIQAFLTHFHARKAA